MTRRIRRLGVLLALLLTVGLGGLASPAVASSPNLQLHVPGDPTGWTSSPTLPLLQGTLSPGQPASGTIGIRNTGTDSGTLTLKASGITGGLAPELQLSFRTGTAATDNSWSGSLSDLEKGVVMERSMEGGTTIDAVFTATLKPELDNRWENGTASFQLMWTLAAGNQASVAKVQGAGSAPPHRSSSALAFTGALVEPSLFLAVLSLVLGVALTCIERRARGAGQTKC